MGRWEGLLLVPAVGVVAGLAALPGSFAIQRSAGACCARLLQVPKR